MIIRLTKNQHKELMEKGFVYDGKGYVSVVNNERLKELEGLNEQ